jgi:hypothetical protein
MPPCQACIIRQDPAVKVFNLAPITVPFNGRYLLQDPLARVICVWGLEESATRGISLSLSPISVI